MNDRDDFSELVGKFEQSKTKSKLTFDYLDLGSAKTVLKSSALHFTGRIRYGTKGEKVEERLLVDKFDRFSFLSK